MLTPSHTQRDQASLAPEVQSDAILRKVAFSDGTYCYTPRIATMPSDRNRGALRLILATLLIGLILQHFIPFY